MTKMTTILAAGLLAAGCVCDKGACDKGMCDKKPCDKVACPKPPCDKPPCPKPPKCCDPVIGNWSATLPYSDGMNACSMIFSRDEQGAPKAWVLWRWASPEWCKDVKIDGPHFSFVHPYGHRIEGTVVGNKLYARIAYWDMAKNEAKQPWKPFEGWRNPEIVPGVKTSDAKLGAPIDLLKHGMNGWELMNKKAKNGWSVTKDADGANILSNKLGLKPDGSWAGGGSNLMTKQQDFYDFNLEYDVRVPKASNSGVYLRGRYEIQVVDSFGKPVDRHNMAAYYGRKAPSKAVEKAPGEWQHVSVTLYRQHLTVVLNGTTIIENEPVVGVTGGAIDANILAPGPIYLQGDHSDADFKNMILRPAM